MFFFSFLCSRHIYKLNQLDFKRQTNKCGHTKPYHQIISQMHENIHAREWEQRRKIVKHIYLIWVGIDMLLFVVALEQQLPAGLCISRIFRHYKCSECVRISSECSIKKKPNYNKNSSFLALIFKLKFRFSHTNTLPGCLFVSCWVLFCCFFFLCISQRWTK